MNPPRKPPTTAIHTISAGLDRLLCVAYTMAQIQPKKQGSGRGGHPCRNVSTEGPTQNQHGGKPGRKHDSRGDVRRENREHAKPQSYEGRPQKGLPEAELKSRAFLRRRCNHSSSTRSNRTLACSKSSSIGRADCSNCSSLPLPFGPPKEVSYRRTNGASALATAPPTTRPKMPYLLLALLWIAWCAIHSGMISLTTTEYLKRRLGAGYRFHRLFFNIFAVVTVFPLFAYTESLQGPVVFRWQGLLAGVQVLLLALSAVLFLAGAWQYDLLQFCGIRQIPTGSSHHGLSETEKFNASGILSVTRHPWYLGGILFVWTADRNLDTATLVMNTILTAYLIVGAILEERKLLKQFGDEYLVYQKSVPMLVPLPWRRAARATKHDSENQASRAKST